MDIAIVIPTLNVGGAEVAATRLVNELSVSFEKVTLIVLTGVEKDNQFSGIRGPIGRMVSVKYLNAPTMIKAIPLLRKFLRKNNFDLVQSMLRGSNYALVLSSLGIKRFAVILREANIILQPQTVRSRKLEI